MNLDKRIEEGIKKLLRRAAAAKNQETKDLEAGKFGRRQAARKKTETPLNIRIAQNVKDATARAKVSGRSAIGTTQAIVRSKKLPSSTTTKLQVGMKGDAGKLGQRAIAAKEKRGRRQWREKEYGKENASTEYEGYTLSEKIEFIKTFLEGEGTGDSRYSQRQKRKRSQRIEKRARQRLQPRLKGITKPRHLKGTRKQIEDFLASQEEEAAEREAEAGNDVDEGIKKELRKGKRKSLTGVLRVNPHAAGALKKKRSGKKRAAKRGIPATGTEEAIKRSREKQPRSIRDYRPNRSDEGKFTRALAGTLIGAAALCTGPGCSDKPAPEKPSVEKKVPSADPLKRFPTPETDQEWDSNPLRNTPLGKNVRRLQRQDKRDKIMNAAKGLLPKRK